MSGDRGPSQADLHVDAEYDGRPDGQSAAAPRITVQVIGLEPQHVRVVERRGSGDEPVVFVELGGDECKVTLAGRLHRLQQVTAEVGRQLAELEEAHREEAGQ